MTEEVIVTRHDGVMRITMNRPTRKNALTAAMYDSITAALENADSDEAVRAVILEGSGGSFTAGNDLADFLAVAAGGAESRATPFVRKIAFLDTPLVAAVDGVAIGVGTTILFHCDLVYVTPRAQFRMPFIDLGLVPEAASTLTAPARLGLAKASELLLLGDGFDAAEAVRLGIANAVVPASELANAALSAARRLAAKPAGALRASRKLIRGDREDIAAAIDREGAAFEVALASAEARAALEAFLAKGKA